MSFQDKTIQCADCRTDFSFNAGEQQVLQSKGYTDKPRRCPLCRQITKTERHEGHGNSYGLPRHMFAARRAGHGKDTEVPFALAKGRLVY